MTLNVALPYPGSLASAPSGALRFDHGVRLPDEALVRGYLDAHPELLATIPELIAEARGVFGEDAELLLIVNRDPELDDPYLVLLVRVPGRGKEMLSRLESIWRKFEPVWERTGAWIQVTTDYRSPGSTHGI